MTTNQFTMTAAEALSLVKSAGTAGDNAHHGFAVAARAIMQQAFEGNLNPANWACRSHEDGGWDDAQFDALRVVMSALTVDPEDRSEGGKPKGGALSLKRDKGAKLRKGWMDRRIEIFDFERFEAEFEASTMLRRGTPKASLVKMAKAIKGTAPRTDTVEKLIKGTLSRAKKLFPAVPATLLAEQITALMTRMQSIQKDAIDRANAEATKAAAKPETGTEPKAETKTEPKPKAETPKKLRTQRNRKAPAAPEAVAAAA